MATWTVEQKVEVWYQTTVEAETLEEAIKVSGDSDDWSRRDYTEWTDEYWVMNEDSTEQYTFRNGVTYAE